MQIQERPSRIQEENKMLENLAEKITSLKLETPALFFLEINKPLCTIAHTASLALAPLAIPFLGHEKVRTIETLLSNRKNIDKLMLLIEKKAKIIQQGVS